MSRPARRKLSRLRRPPDMSLETWQRELRRQFGREQPFALTNVGTERVFSDFEVRNPQSAGTYRVSIRGVRPGENYSTCRPREAIGGVQRSSVMSKLDIDITWFPALP